MCEKSECSNVMVFVSSVYLPIAVPVSESHDVSKLLKTNSLLLKSSAIKFPAPLANAPSAASNLISGGKIPVKRLDDKSICVTRSEKLQMIP